MAPQPHPENPHPQASSSGTESQYDPRTKQWSSKRVSKFNDPCQDAANKSIKCMNRNNGDREMCQDFFQAYRDCKANWMEEMREAKRTRKSESGGSWFSWGSKDDGTKEAAKEG